MSDIEKFPEMNVINFATPEDAQKAATILNAVLGRTDLQVLQEMAKRAGIKFEPDSSPPVEPDTWIVEGGYMGFYAEFKFNPDGSLKDIAAYE